MAYVRIYYHREPTRIAPHVRYIARRPESDGLRGLGAAFRELRGDVDACVRLLHEHAERARVRAPQGTREGPFVRLLFTLPTDLAQRVAQADTHVKDGARLVLRDAVEATFRGVGRQLQGVYAIHFHSAQRAVHGHVHVDLSPLDSTGRPTFVTKTQRERFRGVWEREVVQAVERVERRVRTVPEPAHAATPHEPHEPARSRAHVTVDSDTWSAARRRVRPRRQHLRYVPVLTEWLLSGSRTPLVDLFVRALVARNERRITGRRPALAVRFTLGLPVPRLSVRPTVPLVRPALLRLPRWS